MSNVPQRRHSAARTSLHRSGASRPRREPLRAASPIGREVIDITETGLARDDQPNADMNIVRALMFAQGIDEQGRRLPMASDEMVDEEKRPHHIVPERQTAERRPTEFADAYRRADYFGDRLPNVTNIRPLTRETRLATRRNGSDDGLRFTPAEPPELRVVPPLNAGRTMPRQNLAPTASHSQFSAGPVAIGALAIAPSFDNDATLRGAHTRPALRSVSSSRRPWGLYSVFSFWAVFVSAFLFAAVVMHAGLASRQVKLDRINVQLERSEASNNLLHVEVARLQSPQRIAEAAARLGLVNPERVRFVQAVPAPAITVASASNSGDR
jgi:hypothetical protein